MKYNLHNMMALDLYLSSLSKSDYDLVSKQITDNSRIKTPLLSWDIYNESYINTLENAQRQQDIVKVKSLAKKMNWDNNIDSIFKDEAFEAIIITDLDQNIVWVNKGFTKMTGYTKVETLNKTPRFLQGAETSVEIKQKIKKQLNANLPFKEVVRNYKKDGEPYICEVKFFMLDNDYNKTHFMALERRVS